MADLIKSVYKLPPQMQQSLAATVLVPTNRSLSLVARKAHIVMMGMAQRQHAQGRRISEGFIAPLKDILLESGTAARSRAVLKSYLTQMMDTKVEYRPLDLHTGVIELGENQAALTIFDEPVIEQERVFALLSEVRHHRSKSGDLWVQWFYPPTIMEELLKPTRWAQVNLDVVRALRTYAGVMLYLITVRFKNNPSGMSSRYSVKEMDLYLRSKLEFLDVDADGEGRGPAGGSPIIKYRTWRRLKEDVIKDAIAEVNELADVSIELLELKSGREVTHVQFSVHKREITPVTGAVNVAAVTLGLTEKQIAELEREFGKDDLQEGIARVERHIQKKPGNHIGDTVAYLKGTIVKWRQERGGEAHRNAATTVEPTATRETPPSQIAERKKAAEENRAYLALEREFGALSGEEQNRWVQNFMESLPSGDFCLTFSTARDRLKAGEWQSGLVKHRVLNYYGTTKHGRRWMDVYAIPEGTPI